jgi:effector-binding domain-containing protein
VDADFEIRELAAQATAVVTGHVPPAELPSFFEHAFHDVADALRGQGVAIAGPPFGFYPSMPAETIEVEAGFPVARAIEPAGRVVSGALPGGRVVRALHVGPFEGLSTTYAAVRDWIVAQGLETRAGVWECYLSDPAREPDPATWRTEIFWPIA